ncbi:hypothetical protein T11_4085 [Trichinella zimbabwensis]|uniref:Uncharacterized protein n=1 Tax=Trichinella zimbabwensis TaxID=268475 RepID=A0A0V1GP36_9BILA|nr:hypothetical protein T11_4085 [Trichinella zimbabwensis]
MELLQRMSSAGIFTSILCNASSFFSINACERKETKEVVAKPSRRKSKL